MIIGIYAKDENGGIGLNNSLPWPTNKKDMDFFRKTTTGHIVLMGRKTWESIGSKNLPNRINVVISRNDVADCDYCFFNIKDAIFELAELYPNKLIFIMGGKEIYDYAFENELFDKLLVTTIKGRWNSNKFIEEKLEYFKSSYIYDDNEMNIQLFEKDIR